MESARWPISTGRGQCHRLQRVQIGDIVDLHDHDTAVSPKAVLRWCMVTALGGSTARLPPGSASLQAKSSPAAGS